LLGDGVALGWRPLVDRLLDTGRLVPVGPPVVRPHWGYFLLQAAAPGTVDGGYAGLVTMIRSDFAAASQSRQAS
jgi:hypothetical protein